MKILENEKGFTIECNNDKEREQLRIELRHIELIKFDEVMKVQALKDKAIENSYMEWQRNIILNEK